VSGFHARVVQHECDHLDGVLYPMRMTDLSLLCFVDELRHGLPDLIQARRDTAGSIP
jgi:peptide deformylase